MKIKDKYLKTIYNSYSSYNKDYWCFGNQVLYDMCDKNPSHIDQNIIIGKVWLIGRSYAAAIERIKDKNELSDDFYVNKVAPNFISFGKELDEKMEQLKSSKKLTQDNLQEVLNLHKFLIDKINDFTGMNKHSLVSKYLHFHLPNHFFIYDSRAAESITKFVFKERKDILLPGDTVYVDFCMRAMFLKDYIYQEYGKMCSPREIDNILLFENSHRNNLKIKS